MFALGISGQYPVAFIDNLGSWELLMAGFVAFLLFGGKNLPGFAKTVGRTVSQFRRASGEVQREFQRAMNEDPDVAATPAPLSTLPHSAPGGPSAEEQMPDYLRGDLSVAASAPASAPDLAVSSAPLEAPRPAAEETKGTPGNP